MAKTDARSIDSFIKVKVLISFLHATFIKIGENDSTHELARMLHAGKFEINFFLLFFFLMIFTYKLLKAFPPKHL